MPRAWQALSYLLSGTIEHNIPQRPRRRRDGQVSVPQAHLILPTLQVSSSAGPLPLGNWGAVPWSHAGSKGIVWAVITPFSLPSVPSKEGFVVTFFKQHRLSQVARAVNDKATCAALPSDSAVTCHLQRPALHTCHGSQLPATNPRADLVAYGFLVLLVGGFQWGSGGADADL